MKIFIYKKSDANLMAKAKTMFTELDPEVEYVVTIKKNKPVRSLNANRYYRVILKIIGIHTGETEDRLHMLFKIMFNFEEFTLPNGDIRRIPATTSNLDSSEFTKYISQVKQWAIDEWNVSFPDKNDVDYMQEMDVENRYERIQG
jgi:hypothetical protein